MQELRATRSGNHFHVDGDAFVPLYEAKLVHQFNHRAATFEGIPVEARFKMHAGTATPNTSDLGDPNWTILPRFWIPEHELDATCSSDIHFLSGFRNAISAVADSRSLVATVIPRVGVGHSLPLFQTTQGAPGTAILAAVFNSFTVELL